MQIHRIALLAISLATTTTQAAFIDFSGSTETSNTSSGFSWVAGSLMYENIDSGFGNATAQAGFSTFDGLDISKFKFTYGGLELTDHLSPGISSVGFEIYTPSAAANVLTFSYDNIDWATATVNFFQVDVMNNSDMDATGFVELSLSTSTVAGQGFFDELFFLTGNTGNFTLDDLSFVAVAGGGSGASAFATFSSTGQILVSPVPIPASLWLMLSGLIGFIGLSQRKK